MGMDCAVDVTSIMCFFVSFPLSGDVHFCFLVPCLEGLPDATSQRHRGSFTVDIAQKSVQREENRLLILLMYSICQILVTDGDLPQGCKGRDRTVARGGERWREKLQSKEVGAGE